MAKNNFRSLLCAILVLIGCVMQAGTLPYWLNSFAADTGGAFFVILFPVLFTIITMVIPTFIIKFVKKYKTPSLKECTKNFIFQGFTGQLCAILVVYAASINRTPPVFFTILTNTGVFWSIITRLLFVREKKINYCSPKPIISLLLLLTAICIMVTTKIIYETSINNLNILSFFFALCVVIGVFFGTIYNTLQEKYMNTVNTNIIFTKNDKKYNILYVVAWSYIWQLVFIILFFWTDILPNFGYSTIDTFFPKIGRSFSCYIGFNGCGYKNFLFGTTYSLGYVLASITAGILNDVSASFTMYVSALKSPICSIIFLIVGIGINSTPIYAVIPTLLLMFIGICFWNWWETTRNNKKVIPIELLSPV